MLPSIVLCIFASKICPTSVYIPAYYFPSRIFLSPFIAFRPKIAAKIYHIYLHSCYYTVYYNGSVHFCYIIIISISISRENSRRFSFLSLTNHTRGEFFLIFSCLSWIFQCVWLMSHISSAFRKLLMTEIPHQLVVCCSFSPQSAKVEIFYCFVCFSGSESSWCCKLALVFLYLSFIFSWKSVLFLW